MHIDHLNKAIKQYTLFLVPPPPPQLLFLMVESKIKLHKRNGQKNYSLESNLTALEEEKIHFLK